MAVLQLRFSPASTAMGTLFSENILSPSPAPASQSGQSNPFDLVFQSSQPGQATTPPAKKEWMAEQLQSQKSTDGETSYTHGERSPALRRKGNPRVALMGMRRSGKSSIQRVVFEKLPPADTLYLESTNRLETAMMSGFIHIESLEVPSNMPVLTGAYDHSALFGTIGAVIWIIDSQDEYFSSIRQLLDTAVFLAENYPRVNLEVFIHKTDGLSDEYKNEAFREIRQRVQDELSDLGYGDRSVSYYQTSIFDHSILEATSKVIMKLLPQMPALEALLVKLCSTCRIQKAYLFDTMSKVYIATDTSPTFLKDYEVCSDYVDVVVDIKQLYGWHAREPHDPPGTITKIDQDKSVGESLVSYDRSGDTYIYAREVNDYLSLICIMGRGSSADKKVLIDYNVSILHEALVKVFELS